MSKFCEKCGKPINEGSIFCGSCGNPVSVTTGSITDKTDQPKTYASKEEQEAALKAIALEAQAGAFKKKKKPIVFIIPIVVILAIVGIIFTIVSISKANSLVMINDNNKRVFKYTAEEYVDKFNEANASDIERPYDFSAFTRDATDMGKIFYMSNQKPYMVIYLDSEGYGSKIEQISYIVKGDNVQTFEITDSSHRYVAKSNIPDMVAYELRALYPNLSQWQAKEIIEENVNVDSTYYSSTHRYYKEVCIVYWYDDSGYQHWTISA